MNPTALQATLFDFAIGELVRQHRESFEPLWTLESWAKLMIWLALNCGCSGEREALEQFAAALGPRLTGRLRRVFFERELGDLELKLLADPAEAQVLALPLVGAAAPELPRVAVALERVGLGERVAGREQWQVLEGLVAVPWGERCA
ncbi:protein phosphatase [Cyanobium sp. Morenito 9A2]|uniref:protein phosphatase n=1 Tax=Cyanobium sp. Morenito 9A2 TaxID=2823718 RepID=UPI0020CBDE03|nr:protein phosphatase [Cyanobium sp. Morenito 9A2]